MTFDKTVQKTELWLKELMEKMGWSDKRLAYDGLRAVLHALRDRLPIEAVVKFGAQLPMLVRGFYYENWTPSSTPIKVHNQAEFLELVRSYLRISPMQEENVEDLVYNVFQLIRYHMGSSEAEKLQAILPKSIAQLFNSVKV